MPKVLLVNPRRRSDWDRHAVRRVLNASGGWEMLGERGEHMKHHHHHHKHHRRNPDTGNMIWGVAGAAGGFLLTPAVAGMFGMGGGMSLLVGAGVAVGGGWLLGKFKKPAGWGFAVGGLASVAISAYRQFTGGGMSYYAVDSYPVPGFSTGNPLQLPQYGVASSNVVPATASGAPAALPAPATSATRSSRLMPRMSKAA